MRFRQIQSEISVAVLLLALVALVFQQTRGDMVEQGIASGGPYSNAASYPETLGFALAGLLVITLVPRLWAARGGGRNDGVAAGDLVRPMLMLAAFAVYLWALDTIGYLFSTPALMAVVMALCGERSPLRLLAVPIVATIALSFIFGGVLDVVLPRGAFNLALPW